MTIPLFFDLDFFCLVCLFVVSGFDVSIVLVPQTCSMSGLILLLFFIIVCSFPSDWLCLLGDFFSWIFDWFRVNTIFLVDSIVSLVSFSLFGSVFVACGVS